MVNIDIIKAKKALRSTLVSHLKAMEPEKKAILDEAILRRLEDLLQQISTNHVFCFVSSGHEIDTHILIDWLKNDGKQVSVPKIYREDMVATRFIGWSKMQTNQFGISEPIDRADTNADIDICITPGIGFTVRGERLGMGLGYYDKWFNKHPNILRIAPAYEFQIVTELPVDTHDIGVNIIVTEDRIIRV